jgi:antitoxin (DNA-binding transcriptional repressor) of toxin-antitoxin stability system
MSGGSAIITFMAQPAIPQDPVREISLAEARTRLAALARATGLTGAVTIISDAGRPIAALVPVDTARSRSDAQAAIAQQQAAAQGWQQRLETMREHQRRQHRQQIRELQLALQQTWALIDRLRLPGHDRAVDQLRVQHRQLLAGHDEQ